MGDFRESVEVLDLFLDFVDAAVDLIELFQFE